MSDTDTQDVPDSESASPPLPHETEPVRFPSFAALRQAHGALLDRHDAGREEDDAVFWREIMAFIEQARGTGALLDDRGERRAAYSIVNFWSSKLYEAGFVPPEVRLAPFDETLAPSLDDVVPPYIGLESFSEQTHDRFFGRQPLVEEALDRLQRQRMVAVVGQSGSGKSSLVLGGVLPALKEGSLPGSRSWRYLPRLVPGSEPLRNLASLFRPADLVDDDAWLTAQKWRFMQDDDHLLTLLDRHAEHEPAVLVIDQFEELFTLCEDVVEREAFTDNLLHLVDNTDARHYVMITMRSDYRSNVARLPAFNERFRAGAVNMEALDIGQLRAVIEGPAEQVGLKFDAGVVDDLIEDVLGEPAALPLLQFTLWRLWKERNRNRITRAAYERMGGANRALETCADHFIEQLSPEKQETAKHILLQMVYLNRNLEVTSRRVRRADLYREGGADVRVDDVLQELVDERLVRLTPGGTAANPCPEDDQVEVAHEALIRNWPLLRDWMTADFDRMRQRNNLTHQAEQWAHARTSEGKDETGLLWGEAALEEARTYADLTEQEEAFIKASEAAVARRTQREQETAERERQLLEEKLAAEKRQREAQQRSVLRLRALSAVLVVVLVAAVFFAISAVRNEQRAESNLATATVALVQADIARQRASDNAIAANRNLSSAVAARATSDANATLAATRLAEARAAEAAAETAAQVAAANESRAEAARLANLALQSVRALGPGNEKSILLSIAALTELSTSVDARRAFLDAVPQEVHYTRVVTPLSDGHVYGWPIILSQDGRLAAAANVETGQGADFVVWEAATGETLWQFPRPPEQYANMMHVGDGNSLLAAAGASYLDAWALGDEGAEQRLAARLPMGVTALAVSPVEALLAAAGGDGRVMIWRLGSGQTVSNTLPLTDTAAFGPSLPVTVTNMLESFGLTTALAFSPDGETLAIGNVEGKVVLWDVREGAPLSAFTWADPAPVIALHFSEDGRWMASGDNTGALRLWDLSAETPAVTLLQEGAAGDWLLAFSLDGRRLAASGGYYEIVLWDLSGDEPTGERLFERRDQAALAFAPGGDSLVVAGQLSAPDAPAGATLATARWDVENALSLRRDLGEHALSARSLAFAPALLATGGCAALSGKETGEACSQGEIILWDAAARSPVQRTLHGHTGAVTTLAFDGGGDVLASTGTGGDIVIWEGIQSSSTSSRTLSTGVSISSTVFGPGGDLFVGTADGLSIWENVAGSNPVGESLTTGAAVRSLTTSADGQWLVAGDAQGQVTLWPMPALDEPVVLPVQHQVAVSALAFHPLDALLASGSEDGTVIVRYLCGEAPTVAEVGNSVTGLAFSPDGALLAAGTVAGQVILWQVEVDAERCKTEMQRLGTLSQDSLTVQPPQIQNATGRADPGADRSMAVTGVGFVSGSTPRLLIAYRSGGVQVWELDTAVWMEIGCQIAGRNLTLSEWEEAFPTQDFLAAYVKTCADHPAHPSIVQQAIARAELEHGLENVPASELAYERAVEWATNIENVDLHIALCRSGALQGAVSSVTESCDRAVTLDPDDGRAWDVRGLAQALQGDPQAAAESFGAFVEWALNDATQSVLWRPLREIRALWIEALERGEDPFVDEAALASFRPVAGDEMWQRVNEAGSLAAAGAQEEAAALYADLAGWASTAPAISFAGRSETPDDLIWFTAVTCAYGTRDGAGDVVAVVCERARELAEALPNNVEMLISVCREELWTQVDNSPMPICRVVEQVIPDANDASMLYGACQDALYGQLPELAAIVCPEAAERALAGDDRDPAQFDAIAQAAAYACQNAGPEGAPFTCGLALDLLVQSGFDEEMLAAQYYGICLGGVVNGLVDAVFDACERAAALQPDNPRHDVALAFAETRQLVEDGETEDTAVAYQQLAEDALAAQDPLLQFDICVAGIGDGYSDAVLGACGELRAIAYGEEVTGALAPEEQRFWRFSGEAGERIVINLEQDAGSSLDPFLTLLGTQGEVLVADDDGGEGLNSRIATELPTDGVYWVIASGFGTSSGRYRLEVTLE